MIKKFIAITTIFGLLGIANAHAVDSQDRRSDNSTIAEDHKRMKNHMDSGLERRLQGDSEELRAYLVGTFHGMYYSNIGARADYCRNQGVLLSNFLKVYKDASKGDLAAARKLTSADLRYEERIYAALKPRLAVSAIDIMGKIAAERGITPKMLCETYEVNADSIGVRESFSVRLPDHSKKLRELAEKAN